MRVRKIGYWQKEGPHGNYDHGFYLEAVDAPPGEPRYAQVSYSFLEDADIKQLDHRKTVEIDDLTPDDFDDHI